MGFRLKGSIPFNTNDYGYYSQPTPLLSKFHGYKDQAPPFTPELEQWLFAWPFTRTCSWPAPRPVHWKGFRAARQVNEHPHRR